MKRIIIGTLLMFAIAVSTQAKSTLKFEFTTGSDNLESNSSLFGDLMLNNMPNIRIANIVKNRELKNDSYYVFEYDLADNITVDHLKGFALYFSGYGRHNPLTDDNWNLNKLKITLIKTENNTITKYKLYEKYGRPICRFKVGQQEGISQYMFSEKIKISEESAFTKTDLKITFITGGDDLRGGNDNVNVAINFRNNPQALIFNNINARRPMNNGNERSYIKEVPPNYNVEDIISVTLTHTGGGGMGADNWDLNTFRLESIIQNTANNIMENRGLPTLHRFTGDRRSKTLNRF